MAQIITTHLLAALVSCASFAMDTEVIIEKPLHEFIISEQQLLLLATQMNELPNGNQTVLRELDKFRQVIESDHCSFGYKIIRSINAALPTSCALIAFLVAGVMIGDRAHRDPSYDDEGAFAFWSGTIFMLSAGVLALVTDPSRNNCSHKDMKKKLLQVAQKKEKQMNLAFSINKIKSPQGQQNQYFLRIFSNEFLNWYNDFSQVKAFIPPKSE